MKIPIAASAASILLAAAPCFAQPLLQAYATLGYTDDASAGANLSAVTGRLGARLGRFVGAEGEAGAGVGSDHATFAAAVASAHLDDRYGVYAVGYLPVAPNVDVLARVGYGAVHDQVSQNGVTLARHDSGPAVGGGVQVFLDGANGVRADYTHNYFGPLDQGEKVWSLAYVRKF